MCWVSEDLLDIKFDVEENFVPTCEIACPLMNNLSAIAFQECTRAFIRSKDFKKISDVMNLLFEKAPTDILDSAYEQMRPEQFNDLSFAMTILTIWQNSLSPHCEIVLRRTKGK